MRRVPVLLMASLLFVVGCSPVDTGVETSRQAIVAGVEEAGFDGVGALLYALPGYGLKGTYCTGTLVAPQWVLTAGHCVTHTSGIELSPPLVHFYVGRTAVPGAGGAPPAEGAVYGADAIVTHPLYNDLWHWNDVALIHLEAPVTETQPFALRTEPMSGADAGELLTYVGFGLTSGSGGGKGIKRSTQMPVSYVDQAIYVSAFVDTGICFGDSGGPGLRETEGGEWEVVGVNSGITGEGADPCHSDGVHSRVDYFHEWIREVVDGPPPACTQTVGMCRCDGVCRLDGTCANEECQPLGCAGVFWCLADCGAELGCRMNCYRRALPGAEVELPVLLACAAQACGEASGEALVDCVLAACGDDVEACVAAGYPECLHDADCAAQEVCVVPDGVFGPGECRCLDGDGDGWCVADECDDASAEVHPDADEACGDGVDNDCDGQTDEGCTVEPVPEPAPDVVAADIAPGPDLAGGEDAAVVAKDAVEVAAAVPASGGCAAGRAGHGPAALVVLLVVLALAGLPPRSRSLAAPRRGA